MYNKRTWLNSIESDSTGSIVAFDGKVTYQGESVDSTFLEIADCRSKIRLHLTSDDSKQDFIEKMILLRNEIDMFIDYLKKLNVEIVSEAEELVLSSPVPRTRKPQKARFDFRQSLLNMGAKPVFVNGWMEVRKAKKGANSEAAFSLFYDQVVKSGKDINYVLKKCIEKNWCGFSAEWIKDEIPLSLNKIPDLFEGYEKL